jgi:serine O-acetyltransferase
MSMKGNRQRRAEFLALIRDELFRGKKLSFFRRRKVLRNAGADAVYLIRLMQYHASCSGRFHAYMASRANTRLIRRYNIFVSKTTKIGKGLILPHPTGIILGQAVVIGENCKIFQQVTLGSRHNGDVKYGWQPHVGNNVTLFAGCKLIGNIEIGDGAQIGANAVMNRDAAPGSVWAGIPARELPRK